MNPREVKYDNFLGYAAKFKSERARTVLIKNKARQIIQELAPTNPAYYEKLRERLEKIIEQEEKRRKDDARYFNIIAQICKAALDTEKQRKKLGFSTPFEFAVYEELQSIKDDKDISKSITESIFGKVKEETKIVGWKTKTSCEKKLCIAIYDILNENKYPEDKVDKITPKIVELAKRNLP
jgi:type I restriction enzyme R subunit